MNQLTKKAFTIVELLAVVVIISILSILVVPNISTYMAKSKYEYNKDVKENMVLTAKAFYSEHKERLPRKYGLRTYDYVTLNELTTLKYAKGKFQDADGRNCTNESYVIAINDLKKINYYACMTCEGQSYINETEQNYCKLINVDIEKQPDDDSDETGSNNISCALTKEKDTDTGVKLTYELTGNLKKIDKFVINKDGALKSEYTLTENEKASKTVEKEIELTEFGYYVMYITNNLSTIRFPCGDGRTIDYKAPNNIAFETEQYLVNKESYDAHKDNGYTNEELKELTTYDGNNWKNGYVYVKLNYKNSLYKHINIKTDVNSESIDYKGKNFFWITEEGETKVTITTIDIKEEDKIYEIKSKLDRTPPEITLTNSNSGWTNKAVKINATATDTLSEVKELKYKIGSKDYTDWNCDPQAKTRLCSKTWAPDSDQNYSIIPLAIDEAGNQKVGDATSVKIDITPPEVYKHCFYQKTSTEWQFYYYMRDEGGSGLAGYRWGYCYYIGPTNHPSYMCSSNSAYNRLIESGWLSAASYKATHYNIMPTSNTKTIGTHARMQVKDNAGNIYLTPNDLIDTWYYSGSYSPGGC